MATKENRPTGCTRTPGCLMNEAHAGDCGSLRDLVVESAGYAKDQARRAIDWLAVKVIRALGGEP